MESSRTNAAAFSTYRVQHEEIHSLPCGKSHQGCTAIERITSSHNIAARLQGVLLGRLILCGLWKRRRNLHQGLHLRAPETTKGNHTKSSKTFQIPYSSYPLSWMQLLYIAQLVRKTEICSPILIYLAAVTVWVGASLTPKVHMLSKGLVPSQWNYLETRKLDNVVPKVPPCLY